MKQLMVFSFLVIIFSGFIVKPIDKETINWISFEQLNEMYAVNPKPILIDVYTDWCGWCKEMDKKTYKNNQLIAYVNEKYYAVKFNAETRSAITFNNKTFKYNAQYRTNELAIYLSAGRLSYPTTVFLSGLNGQPAPLPGYLKPKQIEAPMKFFGEKANEKETFIAFNKKFHSAW